MKRILMIVVCLAMLGVAAGGCKKDEATAGADGGKVLNLYSWSEYFPQEVLEDFTKQTGIKVNQTNYDSNETMEAKLASGVADYDVVVPSDYEVQRLIAGKLVVALDRAKLSNFKNLDARLIGQPYDKENAYSIPVFWGTTGIGVNKTVITDPVDSWAVLFDAKNAGKIYMLNDKRENFAVALRLMGKSLNETDEAVLKQAGEKLVAHAKLVKGYDSDKFDEKLRGGDGALVHGYNGQLAKVVRDNPEKFYFVVPKEGATRWVDNLCIPKGSKHAENAHAFLNFILDAKVAAKMVNAVSYASANEAAREYVDAKILNDKNVYPPEDVLKRCEVMADLGKSAKLTDELWTAITAK
jgi:spermidine/putrescine transport system substrate-binding protein